MSGPQPNVIVDGTDNADDDDRARPRGGAFSSFRSPGYPLLFTAGLFSFIAVQMQFLLRGVLAWDLTLREGALGLTYLMFGLSMLVATPLGGVASDRLSKRKVLIVSQAALMGMALFMGTVVLTGVVEFWMLLLSGVVQGVAFGFFGPARVAISSELVGREQLGNAISLSLLSMNGTRVFAPALAGVLAGIALVGIGGAYLISGLCSTISFFFLLRLPRQTARPATDGTIAGSVRRAPANPLAEMVAGVRYVIARPPLRRLVVTSFFVIMFGFNYIAFYPALVKGVFGLSDTWVGVISSASAVGAVLISLPLAARADSPRAKAAMVVAGVIFGVGVMAVGFSGSFWMAFAVICFVGAATTTFQSLSNTLALAMADDAHQGRVQSLMQLSFAGFGIAALPLGVVAEWIGLQPTIVIMGAVAAVTTVIYLILEGGPAGLRSMPSPMPPVDGTLAAADEPSASVSGHDVTRSPAAAR
ncbi:MAG: MFS transporter [Actinomycetota bacterium]